MKPATRSSWTRPLAASAPSAIIEGLPEPAQHEIVEDGALAGPVSKAITVLAIDISDVADAAEVKHHQQAARAPAPGRGDRAGARGAPSPPAAISAMAEAVDGRDAERPGYGRAVDELAGEAQVGPVIDRLAVQPDEIDRFQGRASARR